MCHCGEKPGGLQGEKRVASACLCAEIWGQFRNEDWSFVSCSKYLNRWPQRLWDFKRQYHLGHPNVEFLLKSLV